MYRVMLAAYLTAVSCSSSPVAPSRPLVQPVKQPVTVVDPPGFSQAPANEPQDQPPANEPEGPPCDPSPEIPPVPTYTSRANETHADIDIPYPEDYPRCYDEGILLDHRTTIVSFLGEEVNEDSEWHSNSSTRYWTEDSLETFVVLNAVRATLWIGLPNIDLFYVFQIRFCYGSLQYDGPEEPICSPWTRPNYIEPLK